MNQKLLSKIIATTLAVILTFTNFVLLGVYEAKSYATEGSLENQKIVSNNENVKFDAYFTNEKGNKTHADTKNTDELSKLFLEIQVDKGYLKDSKITILGQDGKEANFKIESKDQVLDMVERIDDKNNIITLKQINSGTNVILQMPITSTYAKLFDLSNFSKINNITLTGVYIDNSGKQAQIEKTINTKNEWGNKTKAIVEQETKTYVPYEVAGKTGTILQTLLKTGLEGNKLPIKQTEISIKVPEIQGVKPEQIIVTANTYATNDQESNKFNKDNWAYDKEKGILNIKVKNEPNDENKVAWNKNVKDEYVITYIYKEKVQAVQTEQKVDLTIESYNNVTEKSTATNILNIKENENKGNIVGTEITSNDKLSKGYIYSNSQKELEYFENIGINVGYANLVDKIIVQNNIDSYINSKNEANPTTINNKNYAYYKTTTINKENFEQILGIDGYIKIIGQNGENITTFTKDTMADEIGNYTYNYETEINEIKIETSKPITEGTIEINHIKSLKGKTNYTKGQIAEFEKLQLKAITEVDYAGNIVEKYEKERNIELTMPSTKIEASVNKQELSTIVKNENVELKVALKTNDISCDLYKNPTVEIVLPSYIKEINIKNIELLFDNELTIKDKKTYVNNNGNVVIQVTLQGEQKDYIQNEVSKGANIVINADITLKKLTPTKTDTIKVYVTNEFATSYENVEPTKARVANLKGYVETPLRAVAPTGMVTTNTVTGYNSKNETVTSISGEERFGKLDALSKSKTATVSANIINNYQNKINNIKILGRLPKANNTNVVTNEDLKSNFDTTIVEALKVTNPGVNYKIYYSNNGTATEDINLVQNGWTNDLANMHNAKSYLIEFTNYEMQTGDMLSFQYKIEIPEKLEYDKSVYTNYVVYFDNIKATETIKDKQIATKVGLSTGEGPHLNVEIGSDRQGEIQEGEIITYTMSVKNIGNTTVNNVKLTGNIPEGTIYTYYDGIPGGEAIVTQEYDRAKKEYSTSLEKIEPNEVKTITYKVEVDTLINETEKTIEAKATAQVENYEAKFSSQSLNNTIIKGYLKVELEMQPSYANIKEGEEFNYILTISNVNDIEKKNVVVTNALPEGLSFVSATKNGTYNKDTNTVTWNLGNITGKASKTIILKVKINKLEQGQSKKTITNTMNIKTDEKDIKTNEVTLNITKPILGIIQSTSTPEKVVAGDTIEYNITIKNIGETNANNVEIKDYLPEGVLYRGSTYIIDGQTHKSWIGNTEAIINIPIVKARESVDIKILALVQNTELNKTEREITNRVIMTVEDMEIASNPVTHTIVEKAVTNDPSVNEPEEGTYKISGRVWLDENQDGKRDDKEQAFSNIKVMLIDSTTGKVVKDGITGINKEQNTNEMGIYTFANLKPGKYLVVFLYDTENYTVTKYQATGVIDTLNSDAVTMNVTLNGETSKAAVANSIEIKNSDVTNIDMGLIKNAKFDLKLDKSISKIVVNNSGRSKRIQI